MSMFGGCCSCEVMTPKGECRPQLFEIRELSLVPQVFFVRF